jgi:tetratricopeptide (TPR) repeat protein/GTPase Era involved in 16S rRNA processing
MPVQLQKPSMSAIRAELIIESLKKVSSATDYVNIFVTGRTTAGKTTLGNRLIGEEYFLSTGKQNTTQGINVIEFPVGLRFLDPPGVDSGDRQKGDEMENYNRVALGLPQVKEFPQINEVVFSTYKAGASPDETKYTIADFKSLPYRPNLIFYIIAPNKQFSRSEQTYLWDLLEARQKVIYVLNMFVDEKTRKISLATEQNINDAETTIKEVHKDVLGNASKPVIVRVNCLTGDGIESLLTQSHNLLGHEKGSLLKNSILEQSQKSPVEFVSQTKKELLKIFAHVACLKPSNSTEGETLLHETCQILCDFIADTITQKLTLPRSSTKKVFANIVAELINKCKEDHYEDILEKKPKHIYDNVAKYKTVYEKVNDYDNPIYESVIDYRNPNDLGELLNNIFNDGRLKTSYRKLVHNNRYHKKTISKQVFDRYEYEYIKTVDEVKSSGKKKYIGSTYNCLGKHGIAFLLTITYMMVQEKFNISKKKKDIEKDYSSLLESLIRQVDSLQIKTKDNSLRESSILKLLESKVDILFDKSFDEKAINALLYKNDINQDNRSSVKGNYRWALAVSILFAFGCFTEYRWSLPSSSYFYAFGLVNSELKNYDEAISNLEESKKRSSVLKHNVSSKLAQSYYKRGLIREKKTNYKMAIIDYEKSKSLVLSYPDSTLLTLLNERLNNVYSIQASDASRENNFTEAIKINSELINLNPNNIEAMVRRGDAYSSRKSGDDREKAISDYSKVIEMTINNKAFVGEVYEKRGNVNYDLGDYSSAIKDYTNAKDESPKLSDRVNPNLSRTYLSRARNLPDKDQAIKDINEAIRLNANNADAYEELGSIYENKQRNEDAISYYKKAIESYGEKSGKAEELKSRISDLEKVYITFYNSISGKTVSVAFTYLDGNEWKSTGWYKVEPNNSTKVYITSNYKGSMYIYGMHERNQINKGSGKSFCVDIVNVFNISKSDKAICTGTNYKKVYMSEISVTLGNNIWIFNN